MTPSHRLPYPGLRPFRREETDLFFGRDDSVDAMIDRLAAKRFLAVLGSSGVGKSSLVRTGLQSGLEMGLLEGAGSRWWVVNFRPGRAPLRNLAHRLLRIPSAAKGTGLQPVEVPNVDVNLLRARLNRSPRSLIEWCYGRLPEGTNLLLLVDQFEELFRYGNEAGREEAEAFVALLLESRRPTGCESPQAAELPIYVTLTMRSEYLGACSLIQGLAEAVSEGAYLVPRMTREQCQDAIVGPARACGIELAEDLVERLLEDLASFAPWDDDRSPDRSRSDAATDQLSRLARRADQLPVMQAALNQMWREALKNGNPDERGITLTVSNYEKIGKVGGAIDHHADSIFDDLKGLGPEYQAATEAAFRALTSGTTIANAVRRPTLFRELIRLSGAGEPVVRRIIDSFRAPDCNFVLPEIDDVPELKDDTNIDLAHESLIRQWQRLSAWLEKEGRAAQDWRRLDEDAAQRELLTGQRLANAVALRNEFKPTEAWSERYKIDLDRVNALVDESIVSSERERRQMESKRRRAVVLSLIAAFAFAVIAVLAGVALQFAWNAQKLAEEKRDEAQSAQRTANEERDHAEQASSTATQLLDTLVFKVVADPLMQGLPQETRNRMFDPAIESYGRLIRIKPTAQLFNGLGSAHLGKREFEQAIEYYGGAIKQATIDRAPSREFAVYLENRGSTYWEMKNLDSALADFDEAIELDPKLARAYNGRGNVYYMRKDYEHALEDYNEAIGLDRYFAEAYNGRGAINEDKKDYNGAIAQYDQAIKLNPKFARAYKNRGRTYRKMGNLDHAVADVEEAIKLYSTDAEGLGGIAYNLIFTRDFAKALRIADQAISLDPKRIFVYGNRAHALMFLGLVNDARALYTKYHGEKNVLHEKSWDASVLEDFAELREAGLMHPLMDEIEGLFIADK